MTDLVWVAAWQHQCCGDPFAVGDVVAWPLDEASDVDWLGAALTPELASRIRYWQERHAVEGAGPPVRPGTVVGIRAAFGRYAALVDGDQGLYPVPGSAVLVDVAGADGRESVSTGERLNGYVVELELASGGAG